MSEQQTGSQQRMSYKVVKECDLYPSHLKWSSSLEQGSDCSVAIAGPTSA